MTNLRSEPIAWSHDLLEVGWHRDLGSNKASLYHSTYNWINHNTNDDWQQLTFVESSTRQNFQHYKCKNPFNLHNLYEMDPIIPILYVYSCHTKKLSFLRQQSYWRVQQGFEPRPVQLQSPAVSYCTILLLSSKYPISPWIKPKKKKLSLSPWCFFHHPSSNVYPPFLNYTLRLWLFYLISLILWTHILPPNRSLLRSGILSLILFGISMT